MKQAQARAPKRTPSATTSATTVISFPMPDNVANSRKHWRVRHDEKIALWALLDERQAAGLIPSPPKKIPKHVTVRSVMRLGAHQDDDNAVARHKPLLDWLKTRGYIVDDRRKHFRWEGFPVQIVKRDGNYSVELTLTAVNEFPCVTD